ncbi:MAG: endo-1,4-beta-xylanase [Planctomycetota bacterium]
MLSFAVYHHNKLASSVNLGGAYVVGTDDVPLRAEISFHNGVITCKKRAAGPAGIALLWPVEGIGSFLLETIRVLERDPPYILQVELARGRLLRINHKLEEWGLLDYEGTEEIAARIGEARENLILAINEDHPAKAAALGEKALALAIHASEEISRFYAQGMIARRAQAGNLARKLFGCSIPLDPPTEAAKKRIAAAFDFVSIPMTWRDIEPTEQAFNWKPLDAWVEALSKQQIPIRGCGLLSFQESHVPDWLYIWEHDFDTIRDLAFEHVRRVVNRYGQYVQAWTVASGLHATNCFAFSFEQLMELTRMSAAITKQASPRAATIVEIVTPWGEYYARNQRTIPPLLYADMAVQSGIGFDAFGLRFEFGPGGDGHCARDMFQISSVLDQFSKLGKPVHVTAALVPSEPLPRPSPADNQENPPFDGGSWHGPWSEQGQSEWLQRFAETAFSKGFVETVAWRQFCDRADGPIPSGGLLRSDLVPKAAYRDLLSMRNDFLAPSKLK